MQNLQEGTNDSEYTVAVLQSLSVRSCNIELNHKMCKEV